MKIKELTAELTETSNHLKGTLVELTKARGEKTVLEKKVEELLAAIDMFQEQELKVEQELTKDKVKDFPEIVEQTKEEVKQHLVNQLKSDVTVSESVDYLRNTIISATLTIITKNNNGEEN